MKDFDDEMHEARTFGQTQKVARKHARAGTA
jgi:hypothetical protein